MAPKSGDWVGELVAERYRVTGRLGAGGMATVYRARDERLGADVVLKVPHLRMASEPEFIARFTREIQALVQLTHPNIVKVMDSGSHSGRPFAVMQYLAGGSLRGRKSDPLKATSFHWLLQMAAALDYIHERKYVHRDVKPENILFDERGQVYLADFGVVKVLADAEKKRSVQLTAAGFVLGTAEYTAPEVLAGLDYDGKADQYSLAITLYEAVTGAAPFTGDTAALVFTKHLMEPVPPLKGALPKMPQEASDAVAKALAKSPGGRFPSCVAFAKAYLGALAMAGPAAVSTLKADAQLPMLLTPLPQPALAAPDGDTASEPPKGRTAPAPKPPPPTKPPPGPASGPAPAPKPPKGLTEPNAGPTKPEPAPAPGPAKPKKAGRGKMMPLVAGLLILVLIGAAAAYVVFHMGLPLWGDRGPDPKEDGIKRDDAKKDDTKRDDTKRDDTKRDDTKRDNGKTDNEKTDNGKKDKVLPEPREDRGLAWLDPESPLWCAAFSPDGRWLVAAGTGAPRLAHVAWGSARKFTGGHERPVRAAAFSRSGVLATVGEDGKAVLWDTAEGRPAETWEAHKGQADCLAWSPCGRFLATGGGDNAVVVWAADGKRELRRLRGHTGAVASVAWSPDGRHLLSGALDGTAVLWDVEEGEPARVFPVTGRAASACAFSPDGKTALVGAGLATREDPPAEEGLHLFTLGENKPPRVLPAAAHLVRQAVFTPDGRRVLSAGQDGKALLWDLSTGKTSDFATHGDRPTGVAVSPDGALGVSVGQDGRLFSAPLPTPGEIVRVEATPPALAPLVRLAGARLMGQTRPTEAVAATPDGKLILTAGEESDVRLWDAGKGEDAGKLSGHDAAVTCVTVAPDGKMAASGDVKGTAILWDLEKKVKVRAWKAHDGAVGGIAFSPKGGFVASAGADGPVKAWEVKSGRAVLETRRGQPGAQHALQFTPDGKTLISCGPDGVIQLWALPAGTERARATQAGPARALALSPDGKTLACGGRELRLWDMAGKPLGRVPVPAPVRGVAFTPDGNAIVCCGEDGVVRTFDSTMFKKLPAFNAGPGRLTGLALLAGGNKAVASFVSSSVPPNHAPVIVTLPEGGDAVERPAPNDPVFPEPPPPVIAATRTYKGHDGPVTVTALSADGKQALTASGSTLHLWDVGTGKMVAGLEGHEGAITDVAFLPGGAAVSVSRTGEMLLWDLKAKKARPLKHPTGNGEIEALAVTANGRWALTGGTRVIQWDLEKAMAHAATGTLPAERRVTAVAMAPDGLSALYGRASGQILRWDMKTPKSAMRYTGHEGAVRSLHFSADGKKVVSASGQEAHVWDAESGEESARFKGHASPVRGARFIGAKQAASADEAGKMWLWDLEKPERKKAMAGHTGAVQRLAAQGRTLISGGEDKAANVWELPE